MSGSKQLLRTNPALTTNYKMVVTSDYKLFLESYNSNSLLSDVKYKKFAINEESYLSERLPKFFAGMPAKTAFEVRKHTETDTVQEDYSMQMDDIYWSGAAAVEDSRYVEEYEYVAPLWIDKDKLPKGFVVLRVDGPGNYNLEAKGNVNTGALGFVDEIVKKWKCVKYFDLSLQTPLGRFLDKNYKSNKYFPHEPFELNLKKYQFSKWNGIDYQSGGYCSKSFFLSDTIEEETTHYEMEEFITDGFKNSEVIMSHILNLKFLFDDTPGIVSNNTTYKRKWSINRYLGFYLDDLELITQVSPVQPPTLKPNAVLINNEFVENPLQTMWRDESPVYIKRGDKFLQVKRFETPNGDRFRVIDDQLNSDIKTLKPDSPIVIVQEGNYNYIRFKDGGNLNLPQYNDANLYIIEILGHHHVLLKNSSGFYINSDWLIKTTNKSIDVKAYNKDLFNYNYLKIKEEDGPVSFKIFRAKFSEISDFDFDRVDTQYSRYEYEQSKSAANLFDSRKADLSVEEGHDPQPSTREPKLYVKDNTGKYFKEDGYVLDLDGNYPNKLKIPASSEYVAGRDLWALRNNKLSSIWDKNQYVCKWGFMNSVSHADYPYKFNNSSAVGGEYNRTPNPTVSLPTRFACNLDWFYTIGRPLQPPVGNVVQEWPKGLAAWTPKSYKFRSLEVEPKVFHDNSNASIANPFWLYNYFDLDLYSSLNTNFDYFEWFFTQARKESINGAEKVYNTKKYAVFGAPDNVNGPTCLFRGLKTSILSTIPNIPGQTASLTTEPANYCQGYKFSVIATKKFTSDAGEYGQSGITVYLNKKWKNALIAIWVKVPHNSITNIESVQRDDLYELVNNVNTGYRVTYRMMDGQTTADEVMTSLDLSELTIGKLINGLNNLSNVGNIPVNYVTIDPAEKESVVVSNGPVLNYGAQYTCSIKLDTFVDVKVGEYLDLSNGMTSLKSVKVSKIITDSLQSKSDQDGDQEIVIELSNDTITDFTNFKVKKSVYAVPFMLNVIPADNLSIIKGSHAITFNKVTSGSGENLELQPRVTIPPSGTKVTVNPAADLIKSVYTNLEITGYLNKTYYDVDADSSYTSIKRYSGAYSPILKNVPLFKPSGFQINRVFGSVTVISEQVGNKYYAAFKYQYPSSLQEPVVGDYVYATTNYLGASDFNNFKFYTVLQTKTLDNSTTEKLVILNHEVTENFTVLSTMFNMKFVPANVTFNVDLDKFGMLSEQIMSKTFDTSKQILKTGSDDAVGKELNSVYPMLDEHGVTAADRFIFKSCWDTEFYSKTVQNLDYYTE